MAQVKGGALLRNARDRSNNYGTFGCLVQSRHDPRTRYILTAGHVIGMNGYARHGDAIEVRPQGGDWTKVAEFETAVKWRLVEGATQVCDAAIARVTNDSLVSAEIEGIGMPGEVSTGMFEGQIVQFHGAGTGRVAEASVHSTGNVVPIAYPDITSNATFTLLFGNQILYGLGGGGAWRSATTPMDSGALVVDRHNQAVGLHIARASDGYLLEVSVCTPLRVILDALEVDLVVAPVTGDDGAAVPAISGQSPDALGKRSSAVFKVSIRSLLEPHNSNFGGVKWQLSRDGLIVNGKLDRSPGELVTVPRVWQTYDTLIADAATKYKVPLELIVATICTESSGRADVPPRIEPGWKSDERTPHRVSVGLMQTLISTAREALSDPTITRDSLFKPETSIAAGTAYISSQQTMTRFDPPLVACAYNAGGVYENTGAANRWKMRQYPKGTGAHADRFVQWFNDSFAYFLAQPDQLPQRAPSFSRLFVEA
ncbi:MAG: transglycosylase SLT domain-containing protein [Candidatus Accumulibacter sp.]|uniref:transglycosylase SLT domain-containing protein n=1 Tax=Accumulibacter sp. TaxID=2053492 RepID=UPI001AC682A0|nr:transglycosylase SLT domain-containing protein [Accumulibacter sp.]MBN8439582.1 transglycosylase SLT domain-containing protein [Accumulibacter sp.]